MMLSCSFVTRSLLACATVLAKSGSHTMTAARLPIHNCVAVAARRTHVPASRRATNTDCHLSAENTARFRTLYMLPYRAAIARLHCRKPPLVRAMESVLPNRGSASGPGTDRKRQASLIRSSFATCAAEEWRQVFASPQKLTLGGWSTPDESSDRAYHNAEGCPACNLQPAEG